MGDVVNIWDKSILAIDGVGFGVRVVPWVKGWCASCVIVPSVVNLNFGSVGGERSARGVAALEVNVDAVV